MWIVPNPPPPATQYNISWPPNMTLILLDTEGLGSYSKSKTYDIKIFALAVLLSSVFIYNSMGSIDEGALDRLSLVAELSNNIKMQETSDNEDPHSLSRFFPKFLWLVRDFSLKLELDGKPISSNEYLENVLKPLNGDPERVRSRNLLRHSITQYFPERSCFTMKRPVADERMLQKLEDLSESELRPQFLEQTNELIRMIYGLCTPKKLFGEGLNGTMFLTLATSYINALNSGGVPTIRSAWDNIIEAECQRHLALSNSHCESLVASTFPESLFPIESDDLRKKFEEIEKDVLAHFRNGVGSKARINIGEWEDKLVDMVKSQFSALRVRNTKKSAKVCEELMDSVCKGIDEAINGAESITMEGLQNLWSMDVNEKYYPNALGPAKHEVLHTYIQKRGFEHAGRVHRKILKKVEEEHDKQTQLSLENHAKDHSKLEKVYQDVKTSWLRSRDEVRELEAENKKLIDVVARFSDVLNDELLRKK